MLTNPISFPSIAEFLFNAPLYAMYRFTTNQEGESNSIFDMFVGELILDGYCIQCGKTSTFRRSHETIQYADLERIEASCPCISLWLTCSRNKDHEILFLLRIKSPTIQKIGQFPSLADVANDESRLYRQVLKQRDGAEIHRAIGLAAHGVGIGSFVYLRRVFERLIDSRFESFRGVENLSREDFEHKRMDEKIELLRENLPEFLVRNARIYAILSKGIHELEEHECLNVFEILKQSLFFILDQDRHKREELERRAAAEKAIATFTTS